MDYRVLENLLEDSISVLTEELTRLRVDHDLKDNGALRSTVESVGHDISMLEEWDDVEWEGEDESEDREDRLR